MLGFASCDAVRLCPAGIGIVAITIPLKVQLPTTGLFMVIPLRRILLLSHGRKLVLTTLTRIHELGFGNLLGTKLGADLFVRIAAFRHKAKRPHDALPVWSVTIAASKKHRVNSVGNLMKKCVIPSCLVTFLHQHTINLNLAERTSSAATKA